MKIYAFSQHNRDKGHWENTPYISTDYEATVAAFDKNMQKVREGYEEQTGRKPTAFLNEEVTPDSPCTLNLNTHTVFHQRSNYQVVRLASLSSPAPENERYGIVMVETE